MSKGFGISEATLPDAPPHSTSQGSQYTYLENRATVLPHSQAHHEDENAGQVLKAPPTPSRCWEVSWRGLGWGGRETSGSSTLSGGTLGKPGTSKATLFLTPPQEAAGRVHEAQESQPGDRS